LVIAATIIATMEHYGISAYSAANFATASYIVTERFLPRADDLGQSYRCLLLQESWMDSSIPWATQILDL
jgi:hypothetical protein